MQPIWIVACASGMALAACIGDGNTMPDAPVPDAGVDASATFCIPPDARGGRSVVVSGSVVAYATGEPVSAVTVAINTAWDVPREFPYDCPSLATVTTNAYGEFGPEFVMIGTTRDPPIMLFLVTGASRAPTISDDTLEGCSGAECPAFSHSIPAPSSTMAAAWMNGFFVESRSASVQ